MVGIHLSEENSNDTSTTKSKTESMTSIGTGEGVLSGGIEVFLRIRPPSSSKTNKSSPPLGFFHIDDIDRNRIVARIPKDETLLVNNSRTTYGFQFHNILHVNVSQDDVFQSVAMPSIKYALQGFNSTIFAYGQTGSGKTYTLTGGPERYCDRGIIPRAISTLFAEFRKSKDVIYSCTVSYMEIYNNYGYDLLAEEQANTTTLEDMPRVIMMEDDDGMFHFRNLSVRPIGNEEEALNYLFLGDTNRAIGETEMNQASSRSHCIFTLTIEGRRPASDKVIRSKLNLVDLAGSERVHKTSSVGQTLNEAKYINTSLFFLEMVIVKLYEKGKRGKERTHIPYRNSMMTAVLKDSLGGNCKTTMIATMSPDVAQTEESISTCSFAQRVALVKNTARVNEDLEPELVIQRLKAKVGSLEEEIKFLRSEKREGEDLTTEETENLTKIIRDYVDRRDGESILNIGDVTFAKVRATHLIFRNIVWEARDEGDSESLAGDGSSYSTVGELKKHVNDLRKELKRREEEVEALVNMVKNGKQPIGTMGSGISNSEGIDPFGNNFGPIALEDQRERSKVVAGVEMCEDEDILRERKTAKTWFRERHKGQKILDENRGILSEKITQAKDLAKAVQKSQHKISYLKSSVEQLRKEMRDMNYEKENDYNNNHHGEYEDEGTVALRDNMNAKEMEYRKSIDTEKKVLTDGFHRLRDIKASIEHLQRLVEKGETRIEIDFDKWYQAALGEDDSCPSHEDLLTSVPRPLESCEDAASHASYQQQNINKPHIALPPGVQLTGNKDIDDNILGCCQELNKFDNGCNINVNAVEATPAASSRGTSATTTTTTTRPKSRIHHNEQDEQLLVGIWKEMTPTGATRSKMSQEFILPPGVELTGDKSIDDSIIACCMANEKLRQRYSNDR